MSDFAHDLPLSNRPRVDESQVTSDRRVALADVIDEAARLLSISSADEAGSAILARQFVVDARLDKDASAIAAMGPISLLSELSSGVRAGRRRGVRALSHAVRAVLRIGAAVDAEPRLPATTWGAVALYAATAAPLERRVVVAGHALRATDADWAFGRGPTLEGRSIDIVAFLLGTSEVPPAPGGTTGAPS